MAAPNFDGLPENTWPYSCLEWVYAIELRVWNIGR
jgi:hypothetical protein